jgi:O-antigen ligase
VSCWDSQNHPPAETPRVPIASPPPRIRRVADALLVLTVAAIPLSTTGMESGVIGLGVLAALGVAFRWGAVRATPLDTALGVFYGTLALSTLASLHPLEAEGWARLWVVLAYYGVFWWIRDRTQAVRLARVLVVAGGVAATYGVLQHFTGADWYRAVLGRPLMVRPRIEGQTGFAVIGFFRNYLTFAHTMLVPTGLALGFALRGSFGAWLATGILVLAILLSTARGAWLATLAVGGVLVGLGGHRRTLRVGALVAVVAATFVLRSDLRDQATHMFATGGENAGRVAIYRANLDSIHDHPLLGLGFGRYRKAAAPYYEAYPEADRRSHAHSNYLQIAAEAGLVGLAAFAFLLARMFHLGLETVRCAGTPEVWATAAGVLAGLVGLAVGGVTQYNFGDAEPAIAMWVALAILMRCREG